MTQLNDTQRACLRQFVDALINQKAARVLIPPYAPQPGFWFGGGNLVQTHDGAIWLSGRYRNHGDSRTGLAAGQRGIECAIFRSDDQAQSFQRVHTWTKSQLSLPDAAVISIEGTSLHQQADGTWELFVSNEKATAYPEALAAFQKPNTGVWSIERLTGPTPEALDPATLTTVLANHDRPAYLHVKDPVVFDAPDGATAMIFCTHPYTWAACNTGLALRSPGSTDWQVQTWELVSRGPAWDVASTRITARLPVPRLGCFADAPPAALYFYDGAECMRPHEESQRANTRPRGYSCEELSGVFFGWDAEFPQVQRLSETSPWFISPWATGSSRYTECLATEAGILTTWQQARADGSQPLVGHFLPQAEIRRILS